MLTFSRNFLSFFFLTKRLWFYSQGLFLFCAPCRGVQGTTWYRGCKLNHLHANMLSIQGSSLQLCYDVLIGCQMAGGTRNKFGETSSKGRNSPQARALVSNEGNENISWSQALLGSSWGWWKNLPEDQDGLGRVKWVYWKKIDWSDWQQRPPERVTQLSQPWGVFYCISELLAGGWVLLSTEELILGRGWAKDMWPILRIGQQNWVPMEPLDTWWA